MGDIHIVTDDTGRSFLQQVADNGGTSSWNFGGDPVESLRAAEAMLAEINANGPCVECGGQRPMNFMQSYRQRMTEQGVCFSCLHWRDIASGDKRSHVHAPEDAFAPEDRVVVDGWHYIIAPDAQRGFRGSIGHGGAEFIVEFHDGRRVITHNLWSQGHIPAHFRDRLPDNAVFVKRSTSGFRGYGSAS